MHYLFTDGGSRGNPGPAAIGAVILDDTKNPIKEISKYIGEKTNNQAEYLALEAGLKAAHKNNITELKCYLDSQLIVRQLNGQYRVKNPNMKPLFEQCQKLIQDFNTISFTHVKREKNKHADSLVNKALDAQK